MKNRMEDLLSGQVDQHRPELIISPTELRLQIREGKQYKGSVSLSTADGSNIRGLVTTDCHRVLLADSSIAGDSCTVQFGVDTTGLKEGELVEGSIIISCNLAERKIPFRAEITGEMVAGAEGEIKTLEDFTRLCMKSFRDGFRLFTSPAFAGLLRGKNRPFLPLYKGLSHNPVTYQHLEEFLISTGRKEAVTFVLDKQTKEMHGLDTSQKDTLYLYKNNWGYLRVEVEAEGSFLSVEKKVITSEDFIGRVYGLEYIIHYDRLHQGRNFGRIRLKSVHQETEFVIEADAKGMRTPVSLHEGKLKAAIARDMLNLQLHKIDYRRWYEKGQSLLADLKEWDPESSVAVLYDAYLSYSADDLQRMHKLLSLFRSGSRKLKSEEEEIWYLYLQKLAGIKTKEIADLTGLLRRRLEQNPDQYLYLHLLLQEDPSYEHMPARIMFELEQCYDRGCASPFLYLKAWKMLEEQGSLLRRLTPFYLQVLRFASSKKILSESLYRRCAFLSGSLREFSDPVYQLLLAGYRTYQSTDILEAVCKLIMKGNALKREYFTWYSLAVKKDLRITRLYEYYMETLPEQAADEIPRQVRMYFAYNHTLGEKKRALLYTNVLKNRKTDPACYRNYERMIREFTLQSLEKGRISEVYAYLYQQLLHSPESREQAEKLVKILFCHKVEVKNPSIRNVIVCHYALNKEQSYPCRDGAAYVNLYSEDAALLFEDEKKRRFSSTVAHTCSPMMDAREIARNCMDLGVEDTGLQLYCCKEKGWKMEVNSRTLECFRLAEGNEEFSDGYRRILRQKLLEYYMENQEDERLLISVLSGDMRAYAAVDSVSTAVLMIETGLYEKAFQIVSEFGCEGIPEAALLRLASRMVLKKEFEEDEELLCLAEYVFRQGKYDEILLTYLLDYSIGSIEYLCRLWRCGRGFRLESLQLEKRILVLAVLTGRMPQDAGKILESYILNQGQETVITSFLTWASGCWIYSDVSLAGPVFLYLERLIEKNWKLNLMCRLALLKYYAGLESLNPDQEKEAERILALCSQKKLSFAFFKELPGHLIRPYHLEDKLFVEERFLPGTEVTIHYCLNPEEGEEKNWKSEPLREMLPGIYSREFLLFYGEVLDCYLTYRNQEEELGAGNRRLTLTNIDSDGVSRYKILNRILTSREVGNKARMDTAVEDYLWQDAFTEYYCTLM